jgi:ribosome-associated translation inhibitor RaiA
MPVEVTTRHIEVRKGIQLYAHSLGEMLLENFPRLENVHIVLDAEKHQYVAAVVVQGRGHVRFEAVEKSDDNMRVAVDGAFGRAERHLRKQVSRVRDRKKTRVQREE